MTVAITAVIVVAGLSVGGVLLAGKSSGTTTPKATPSATATASPTPTPTPSPSPTVAEPADHTPFGKIVTGLNILQTVAKGGYGKPLSSAGGGAPNEKVEFESVTIKQT